MDAVVFAAALVVLALAVLAVVFFVVVVFLVVAFFVVAAFFTALAVFVAAGTAMIFTAPGVGDVVQRHAPSASAHALPSPAVPYESVAESSVPSGLNSAARPPLLLIVSPVSLA